MKLLLVLSKTSSSSALSHATLKPRLMLFIVILFPFCCRKEMALCKKTRNAFQMVQTSDELEALDDATNSRYCRSME
jgi:hypothetical protein